MASYNRIVLVGNLTRDPQLSYTPANTAVCKFGMAMNRKWTDRNTNEQREDTCFVDCTSFEVMRALRIQQAFSFDRHFHEQGFALLPRS